MSRGRTRNPCFVLDGLEQQVKTGKPAPEVEPQVLRVSAIKLMPEVFQHRRVSAHVSDSHIRVLADAAKVEGKLKPVLLWWTGKNWVCIDGHHRLAAYIKAGMRDEEVPVRVFKGSPADAVAKAAKANTADTLPMNKSEKINAGWRLVVLCDSLSKSQQSRAAGISVRQIAAMRVVKKKLLAQGLDLTELAELHWHAARAKATGEEVKEWSEEEEERRVEKMALALRKALGPTAESQPELFAKAVAAYSPRLAKGLESWFGRDEEDEDQEELEDA